MTKTLTAHAALACAALFMAAGAARADESPGCSQAALGSIQAMEQQVRHDRYASWNHYQRRHFEDAASQARTAVTPKASQEPLPRLVEAAKQRRLDDQAMADVALDDAKAAPSGKEGAPERSAAYATRSLWLSVKQADSAVLRYAGCGWAKPKH